MIILQLRYYKIRNIILNLTGGDIIPTIDINLRDLKKRYRKKKKGFLILIGGNEEKKRGKRVLETVLNINQSKKVAVIPTASSDPSYIGRTYVYAFGDLGADKVEVLDIRCQRDANEDRFVKTIEDSDLIFFTGGDQERLVNILDDTRVFDAIMDKYKNQGVTLAGTSAGAAAACDPILFSGDDRGYIKGSVRHSKGFDLVKDVTIDTHFLRRNRMFRLIQYIITHNKRLGIGLAEDSGIIVCPDNKFYVIGSSYVTLVRADKLKYTNYDKIEEGDRLVIDGIKVSYLSENYGYNLNTHKVLSPKYKKEKELNKIKEKEFERFSGK